MSVTGDAGLLRQLAQRAVVVEAGHRGEAVGRHVGRVRRGDQRVGVRRVADHEDAHVVGGARVDRLALRLEDAAVGLEQVAALHAGGARAGADEQGDVDAVERRARVVGDVDAGQQRERAVVELHRGALGRLERRRDLEQSQPDRDVGAEQLAGRHPEQQGVADLAGRAGDGDGDGCPGHEAALLRVGGLRDRAAQGQVSRRQETWRIEAISALSAARREGRAAQFGVGTATASTTRAVPIVVSTRTSKARLRTTSRPTRRAGSTSRASAAKQHRDAQHQAAAAEVVERHRGQPDETAAEHGQQRPLPADPAAADRRAVVDRPFLAGDAHGASTGVRCDTGRSALSTTLSSSIARVIGPTPPGTGATYPATSRTSGATSPTSPPEVRVMPTSTHRGARPDQVRGDQAGHAGRRHDHVGAAQVAGEVTGAGVAQRHRGVLGTPGQQQPERPPDGDAATDDHDVRPGQLDVVAPQQRDDAARGARQRAGLAQHQPAEVRRVQPVGVLGRVHPGQSARRRRALRAAAAGRCSRCTPGRR